MFNKLKEKKKKNKTLACPQGCKEHLKQISHTLWHVGESPRGCTRVLCSWEINDENLGWNLNNSWGTTDGNFI